MGMEMKTEEKRCDCDVAIVGGGSAGYAAARTAAAGGLRVVLIEGEEEVGGLCILRGCMPTKSMLYAAEMMHLAGKMGRWGIGVGEVGFEFDEVMKRKDAFVEGLAEYRRGQIADGAFDFIRGEAKFADAHRVVVAGYGEVRARHFILATGSSPASSRTEGLDEVGYLTSDDAVGLKALPKSLIILGGGAVAVEFAQFFGRFGVEVTLVQRSEHVLSDVDVDAAEVVEEVFRREGIRVLTGTEVVRAEMSEGGKRICFRQDGEERWVEAEEILLAQGRVANTAGLELEKAWVDVEKGRILTNEFLQTSVSHIFAAGDCASLHKVVHLAVRQGEMAGWNVAKPEEMRKVDERLAISIVFTEPQVASVGLTEKEAEKQGVEVVVARYAFSDHGKAVLMEATDGFVKLLADAGTGEILGGACVGPHGGELIHEIVVAMAKRMTVRELAELPHYHPTLAEIWTYPAEELVG